jgi:hypothetical protein
MNWKNPIIMRIMKMKIKNKKNSKQKDKNKIHKKVLEKIKMIKAP